MYNKNLASSVVNNSDFEAKLESLYKYPHLSLVVLETFFENDAATTASARPIIERYAEHVGLRIDHGARDDSKFREHTLSALFKEIVDMDAAMREKIFGQKVLSSLTILLELMIKTKLETLADVVWFSADEDNVNRFRTQLEKKGYIKKFNDAVMHDIIGKDTEMKRKKNDSEVGVSSPVNAVPEVIMTKTRKVQLFPALQTAWKLAVVAISSLISSVLLAVISVGMFTQHSPMASLQCLQYAQQLEQSMASPQQMQAQPQSIPPALVSICDVNTNSTALGIGLIVLALIALIIGILFGIRVLRTILHNQFANAHNNFELAHFQMTKR